MFARKRVVMPTAETAPKGRPTAILSANAEHYLFSRPLHGPYPAGLEVAIFGLGCFWGAERLFWQLGDGIWITAVGYAGGYTPNATYEEVCTGATGHAEVVVVVYDPKVISYETLLKTFWEAHDPTQGFRQGNDVGTQYRSAIYTTTPEQFAAAEASKKAYEAAIAGKGYGAITTEIQPAPPVYLAEDYHQQYLAKIPHGYCGLKGTGVSCPMPASDAASAEVKG
ncbi:peptide-methionine (S)-S-oxide reductase MsrA [Hyphomicrobium sp. MC1]|uniref:peptide-methionine (S)-S-oxide reductase MsrA n=1 Tax=Hyphomicrobium sp. (strain MC1) TaxID=717785 RepID=UPI000213EABF|nr:peptide-methionine (S)-S-oxide reductase MsrA [Hyphomicrobium sp. MC1]CCB64054.1 peptide methionine sulfoxide reductase [Hyphomicrobium sp. MC1]